MAVAPEVEQYLEAFLVEAGEELGQIQACLDRLQRDGAKLAVVEEAARATANLKSAAATMGFRSVRDLAHATWDMLNAWRRGGVKDPGVSLELLTRAYRRLEEFIKMLREGRGPEPSVVDLTLQLRALVSEDAENPWPEAEPSMGRDVAEYRLVVRLEMERPCPHPVGRFLVCQGYLLSLGRVLASDPPSNVLKPEDQSSLRFLLSTSRDVIEVRRTVEQIPHVLKVEVSPAAPELDTLPPLIKERKRSIFQDWLVRLEARQLDELEEIVAELAQIRTGYRALEREAERMNPALAFRLSRLGDRSEYPVRQLGELLAQFHRIPIESIMEKLSRFANEQAKAAGKEIEFRTIGGEIAITVEQAEALYHPLQRLIDTVIAQSALLPEDRQSVGKKRANRLELLVQQGEAKTVLSLSDDGAGLDLEKEFRHGGCLAEIRRMFESCGGTLDGQSWPGQGMLLNLEITPPGNNFDILAIELGSDLYALPLGDVVEARRASDEAIVRIDARDFLPQNREMIPVYDLAGLLGRPSDGKGGFWLFLRRQDQRFVLRAPTVLGSRRVFSRPSPGGLKIPGLSGVCADSNGRAYFLLSADQLAKIAAPAGRQAGRKVKEAKA